MWFKCEQEKHKIFCPKWIYYIMPKVNKGMVPPLFWDNWWWKTKPNGNLTWSYLKSKMYSINTRLCCLSKSPWSSSIYHFFLFFYIMNGFLQFWWRTWNRSFGQVWRQNIVTTKPSYLLGGYSKHAMSQRSHGKWKQGKC